MANIIYVAESPWMEFSPDGDAITHNPENLLNSYTVSRRDPCKSILTTIVVTPDENLGMCCGISRERIPDVNGGNLRSQTMREMVGAALTNFVLIWLLVEGPERMLAWAGSIDKSIQWENRYSHNCDACRAFFLDEKVRKVVAERGHEKLNDVLTAYALFLETSDDGSRKFTQSFDANLLFPVGAMGGRGVSLVQLSLA